MKRKELAFAASLIALALVSTYWNVLFKGESLVYSDNLDPMAPGKTVYGFGPNSQPPARWDDRNLTYMPNFHDYFAGMAVWETSAEILGAALVGGEWPLWDPYVGAGAPQVPNPITADFFPPSVALVLLGNTPGLQNAYAIILIFQAGLFTYLFLRRHDLGPPASLFGGLAFAFAGGVQQLIGSQMGQTTTLIPLAAYATRAFLDRPTWPRTAGLAVVYAFISLTSVVPLLAALFTLTSAYALWTILGRPGERARLGVRFGAAVLLSLGLSAFYYAPLAAMAFDLPGHIADKYESAAQLAMPPQALLALVSPVLFDGTKVFRDPPVAALTDWSHVMRSTWYLMPFYVGMLPILAGLLARPGAHREQRRLRAFALGAIALLTLKLVGAAPLQWIAHLPGLKQIHFVPYWSVLYGFLFAVLGSLGIQSLMDVGTSRWRVAGILLAGGGVLGWLRVMAGSRGAFDHPHVGEWLASWWFLVLVTLALSLVALAGGGGPFAGRRLWLAVVLIGVGHGEALWNTVYPRHERYGAWQRPRPYVAALVEEAGDGRVFATSGLLQGDSSSVFGVFGLDSVKYFNSERTTQLYRRYAQPDERWFYLWNADRLPPDGVLDRAAIEHVLVPPFTRVADEAEERGYENWYEDADARLYRRGRSPRYRFSTDYRVLAPEAALEAIATPPVGGELILDRAPSFASRPNTETDPTISIVRFGRNGYTLTVDAPRPGLVYCAESDYRGWQARVNGSEVETLKANYAFRAVEVPAGEVIVEMSYWPVGLSAGLATTACSTLIVLGLWAAAWRQGRAPLQPEPA